MPDGVSFPCAVVPFVHSGMEQVLPKGSAFPKVGQSIRVLVGEPVAVADLQEAALAEHWPDHVLYSAIADRIGAALHTLKGRLEGLPVSEVKPPPVLTYELCSAPVLYVIFCAT